MLKSPISILQELATKQRIGGPLWEFSGSGQDHTKTFECSCAFNGQVATGTGATKKEAKHTAATNMLKVCGIEMDSTEEIPNICLIPPKANSVISVVSLNYVGRLNEFGAANRCPNAVYKEEIMILNSQFCFVCQFQEFTTKGYGSTKKEAKQDAAKNMLQLLKEKDAGADVSIVERPVEQSNDENKEALEADAGIVENLSNSESVSTTTVNPNAE